MIGRRGLVGGIIGVGAAGGLGAPRHDQHYEPPAGGQSVPGGRAVLRAREVIITGSGPNFGLFVYSPKQGLGNLIASITAGIGTDPVGNATLGGFTSYRNIGGTFYAYQVGLAATPTLGVLVFSAPSAAGPYGSIGELVNFDPSGGPAQVFSSNMPWTLQNAPLTLQETGGQTLLNLTAFASATLQQMIAFLAGDIALAIRVAGDAFQRVTIAANGTINWGTGAAASDTSLALDSTGHGLDLVINANNRTALSVQNQQTNGGQSLLQLTGTASTDRAVGIQITGDTNLRVRIDQTPQIHLGSGTASPDVTIGRNGAGGLAMDYIAYANNGGTPEIWNAVGGVGNAAFSNGWLNAAAGPNLQYRRVAAPYNSIQWVGRLTVPLGIVVNSQSLITTSPTGAYHPNNAQSIIGWDITANVPVRFQVGTGGALSYQQGAIGTGDTVEIPLQLPSLDA